MDCPICGEDSSLTFFPKDKFGPAMIKCVEYDSNIKVCGAEFNFSKLSIESDWVRHLLKKHCLGDSNDPQVGCLTQGNSEEPCTNCDALNDDRLIYDGVDVREMELD
jgi:hypothetical protein